MNDIRRSVNPTLNQRPGKQAFEKCTALYSRLSKDEAAEGDSLSIQNQKAILEEHARKNGFTNIRHFILKAV